MGYEYKIAAKLTDKQVADIQDILVKSRFFDQKNEFTHKVFWDFRHPDNKGKMPNIHIVFENDGIYVCQNSAPYIWTDLVGLKEYLDKEIADYTIIDYDE